MSINYPIHNLLHSIDSAHYGLNILYVKANSLFDYTINSFTNNIRYFDESIFQSIPLSYGLCIINEPIRYSQEKDKYSTYYTNKVLFFHDEPSNMFKKEDLYILNTGLKDYYCYAFIDNFISWGLSGMNKLSYGIPLSDETQWSNRSQDVAIIDFNNSRNTISLFQAIKNYFPNTDMLTHNDFNGIDSAINKLSKYKVCIDIQSYYNVLVGASAGCYGITSKTSSDSGIIYQINSFPDMIDTIKRIINNHNSSMASTISKIVINKYQYLPFQSSIINLIQNHSKGPITV